ncbi:MAG: BTAD domain-containing putative transcriptional regulator, partial [Gaiellaceae bacterium]
MGQIEIRLLGPVAVERDGARVRLAGPKQRAVLALLAGRPGAVVSSEWLVDALWGEEPPRTAATALQGHVSQLRRQLQANVIVTRPPGYALEIDPAAIDARRFERLVEDAQSLPPLERAKTLRLAAGLWRGPAFADLAGSVPSLQEEAERLDELRLTAGEQLFEAELALARHAALLPELEAFVRAEPLRGRAVGQLMLALYRSGRQVDALAAYRRLRHGLNETLGLEPDHDLRELERRILAQDPALAPPIVDPRPGALRRLPLTVAAVGLEAEGDADLDAEAYAQTTARAREAVRLVLERHGGGVERAGGAVVGLFGAPAPSEDDAARAVLASRAALAAVEGLRDESGVRFPIRARAGVATGESFGGESPAVERALRLQAQAAPGELVVDEATRLRARPRALRPDRPLAGRSPERRRLSTLYANAQRDRRSAFVTLAGPAGIGKSRLAEDLAASARSARVLRTRCLSYGDGIGLLPAVELVRGAAGLAADATAAAARSRLAELLPDDDRAVAAVEQLLAVLGLAGEEGDGDHGWAVRLLLEALAERSPLLAIVDDLHWADPGFVEIVERLAEPIAAPLVVVATAREVPSARLGADVLELAPLTPAACAEIVADLLGAEIEARSLRFLVERSGGNPLFLEELVLDLRASGRLRAEGAWRLDDAGATPPPSIQSLLAARLESLPEQERDLLSRCSVLGRSFSLAALSAVAEDRDTAEPLAGLVSAGLLQPSAGSDDLEFRHALIRDAAYTSLPLELKAELHEREAARLVGLT